MVGRCSPSFFFFLHVEQKNHVENWMHVDEKAADVDAKGALFGKGELKANTRESEALTICMD